MYEIQSSNCTLADRAKIAEFDWTGTFDPSPLLAVPAAIDFLEGVLPGGLDAVRAHNRALVLEGRGILCEALGVQPPAPDAMIGSLVTLPLPASPSDAPPSGRVG